MTDHTELESSVAAYVLGACEADEAEEVRLHLIGCDSCRALAAHLGQAADQLPLLVEEVQPPAHLKERILAAATRMPAVQSWAPTPRFQLRWPAWWGRVFRPGPAGALALAAVVVALGAWNLSINPKVDGHTADSHRYSMKGSGTLAGAQASVVSSRADDVTVLDFHNMPPAAPGKVYEVWLIDAQRHPVPAVVFHGSGTVVIKGHLEGVRVLAVTIEEGPQGVLLPTQDPQMIGSVA